MLTHIQSNLMEEPSEVDPQQWQKMGIFLNCPSICFWNKFLITEKLSYKEKDREVSSAFLFNSPLNLNYIL